MVKEIPLQNGMFALVDDEDYERCMEHFWSFSVNGASYCRIRNNTLGVDLHEFIMGELESDGVVVFKDSNYLNHCKRNLAIATTTESHQRRKGRKGSSSKYKGVHFDKSTGKWRASITVGGETKKLGRFEKEDDAAIAYNKAASTHFGEHSYQNIVGELNNNDFVEVKNIIQRRRINQNGYKGVYKNSGKFASKISIKGKMEHLGTFITKEEAAIAYDKKAKEIYGDKAVLNFPEEV